MEFQVEDTEFTVPEAENPFKDIVAAHITAAESNPAAAKTITVSVRDAGKAQLFYQRAANELGKTAKLRNKDESGVTITGQDQSGDDIKTGNVKLTFTITKKNKSRRGKKTDEAVETTE